MNQLFYFTHFIGAASYDCNAYGAGGYNAEQNCTTGTDTGAGATTDTSSNTGLAATGTNIAIGVGGGLALVVAGVVILMKLRRKKS